MNGDLAKDCSGNNVLPAAAYQTPCKSILVGIMHAAVHRAGAFFIPRCLDFPDYIANRYLIQRKIIQNLLWNSCGTLTVEALRDLRPDQLASAFSAPQVKDKP